MHNPKEPLPVTEFLAAGIERGGFATEDVLGAILPLMRQVEETHQLGKVAPLAGIESLRAENGHLYFSFADARQPTQAKEKLQKLQQEESRNLAVVAHKQVDYAPDGAFLMSRDAGEDNEGVLTRPLHLSGYICWEHTLGHHDALSDIYSLGILLASFAFGLDFTVPDNMQEFVLNADRLSLVNEAMHPVLVHAIRRMTALHRKDRAQDLHALIQYLEGYREQATTDTLDFEQLAGVKEGDLQGRRGAILDHMRNRLFELTRRNRLLYFRDTMQTLNLTVASVPLLLDVRNIKSERLFYWHPTLAKSLTTGKPISLNTYLSFENNQYALSILTKIRQQANRDRKEYGFAQLRLVLVFLRWHNFRENKAERIHSPLLLLPSN